MSLVVNHNLMATNTARNLNTHYGRLAASTQRLSSGLRINGAADDAAGLAIRELMRADVAALHQGVRNANDAISMLQVADGALGIIDEKLIRMKELAEQAATGTYNSTQRLMIDSEFQAMASEIQRIAIATDFNGIKLIDGVKSNLSKDIQLNIPIINHVNYVAEYKEKILIPESFNGTFFTEPYIDEVFTTKMTNGTQIIEYYEQDGNLFKKTVNDITISEYEEHNICEMYSRGANLSGTPNNHDFTSEFLHADSYDIMDQMSSTFDWDRWLVWGHEAQNMTYIKDDTKTYLHRYQFDYDVNGDGINDVRWIAAYKDECDINDVANNVLFMGFKLRKINNKTPTTITKDQSTSIEQIDKNKFSEQVRIHFGPMNDSAEDYYDIEKRDCTLKGLGLEDVRIETQDNAQKALVTINDAIVKKDQARAYYGAMQNRLENTVSNLTIQAENLQASESRISDVDVATEMTNFVRNQILTQSAVAMLSQANTLPQMAMQLIGG